MCLDTHKIYINLYTHVYYIHISILFMCARVCVCVFSCYVLNVIFVYSVES